MTASPPIGDPHMFPSYEQANAAPDDTADNLSIPELVSWAKAKAMSGAIDEAETICQSVLGAFAPMQALHGSILARRGNLETAIVFLRSAVALDPTSVDSRVVLARMLCSSRRWIEARDAAEAALSLNPDDGTALICAGEAFLNSGGFERAIDHFRRATELAPATLSAWLNLGVALAKRGRFGEAVAAFQKVVDIDPNAVAGWANLACATFEVGRCAEASEIARRALELSPDDIGVNDNVLFYANTRSDESPSSVYELHRAWGDRMAARRSAVTHRHSNPVDPERPLRIGYVSPDFRGAGGVASFIEPLLRRHSKKFEITCYSTYDMEDITTAHFRALVGQWRSVAGQSIDSVEARVRQDGIDILVDLAGHAAGNMLELFARKPAPIQVTYLGYPNTTGLRSIDYRITDSITDPPGTSEQFHTERLVRPSSSFLCYAPMDSAPDVHPPPLVESGHVTFGSFNNRRKITTDVLETWAAVLAAVPGARLCLKAQALADPICRDEVSKVLAGQGVSLDRFDLVPLATTHLEHLDQYKRIDIALDTFPYNGTTTTIEALWMGVPVVTLSGSTHRSRVGRSLLTNAGLFDLVASSREEFVEIARGLARNPQRICDLRTSLRGMVQSSPIMHRKGFGDAIDATYREMWREWCARQQ